MNDPVSPPTAEAMQRHLGDLVRGERQRRKLTQGQVAQAAGVSRPIVIQLEAGRGVSSSSLLAIMSTLGISFTRDAAPASPAHARPTLKQLMAAERERLATMNAHRPGEFASQVAQAVMRSASLKSAGVSAAPMRPRPTLRELMQSEGERQNALARERS